MFGPVSRAIGVLPFIALAILAAAVSSAPALWVFHLFSNWGSTHSIWVHYLCQGMGVAVGYYVYGFSIIHVAPLLNFLLRASLKPWRGPAVSLACLRWYAHNTLTIVVRYSFLEFVTPTEFCVWFYRLMGMKIGRHVTINSTAISDPSLIELEDYVTIGGTANVMAHYAQGGFLVIAPVKIRRGATIGLRATIMGGVEIGEKAKVLANSFVLPGTVIPAGETWGGIPAAKVELKRRSSSGEALKRRKRLAG